MHINILHIETSTKACSVALSQNGKLLNLKELNEDQYSHGELLTLFIEEVMQKSNLKMVDLSAVSVASGPGSYTGLRIGVSTAKGLCYALKIPLIAIDSLSSMTQLAMKKHHGIRLCASIDARRMEIYNAIYSENGYLLKPISADVIDENSYEEFLPMVVFGDANSKLKEIWANRNIVWDDEIFASSIGQIDIAYEKYKLNKFEDLAYFEPFYLKDFLVTTPKK